MNEWNEILESRTSKKLNPHEVEIWETEINEQVRDCSASEIVDGVRSWCEEKRKGIKKYQITVNDIISSIIKLRYQIRTGASEEELTTQCEEQVNKLKHKIRTAETDMDKWNIICKPRTVPECAELEKFAESLGEFTRPKFPSIYNKIKDIGN